MSSCTQECSRLKLTTRRNHCSTCHEFFNSNSAFDMHRTGSFDNSQDPRRCRTQAEMLEIGMDVNQDGYWVTELNRRTFA